MDALCVQFALSPDLSATCTCTCCIGYLSISSCDAFLNLLIDVAHSIVCLPLSLSLSLTYTHKHSSSSSSIHQQVARVTSIHLGVKLEFLITNCSNQLYQMYQTLQQVATNQTKGFNHHRTKIFTSRQIKKVIINFGRCNFKADGLSSNLMNNLYMSHALATGLYSSYNNHRFLICIR